MTWMKAIRQNASVLIKWSSTSSSVAGASFDPEVFSFSVNLENEVGLVLLSPPTKCFVKLSDRKLISSAHFLLSP